MEHQRRKKENDVDRITRSQWHEIQRAITKIVELGGPCGFTGRGSADWAAYELLRRRYRTKASELPANRFKDAMKFLRQERARLLLKRREGFCTSEGERGHLDQISGFENRLDLERRMEDAIRRHVRPIGRPSDPLSESQVQEFCSGLFNDLAEQWSDESTQVHDRAALEVRLILEKTRRSADR